MKTFKQYLILLAIIPLLGFLLIAAKTKESTVYGIGFYNVENLFDTIHDANKNDYDYLIGGKLDWNREKYSSKLTNIAKVLSEMGSDKTPNGPAVIGLAEIENFRVLLDLILQPELKNKYQYLHYEGEDKRGIDCALLYNPELFLPQHSLLVPSKPLGGDTIHKTRGFLVVSGLLGGEKITLIVNHWPSRGAESPVRVHAGEQVKLITDSIYNLNSHAKIVVMGDLNDDPMDPSVAVALGAKKHVKNVKSKGLYNPWWEILEDKGVGTLLYRGKWNLFDQIIISEPLLKAKSGLHFVEAEVFMRDYLFEQEGKYKGSPFRTFGGKKWLNGYSDHLPTLIYLAK